MPKGYGSVAAGVAKVGIGKVPRPKKVRKPRAIRPTRPYTRKPPAPRVTQPPTTDIVPRAQTPTMTGTGMTAVDGGDIPGAPQGIYGLTHPPAIKNYRKARPEDIAAGMLAPQYAALSASQRQQQLMSGQQRAAITGFGGELAKILGQPGPGGVKGTLGPDYAAALSMSALRNFAYQQFLTAQDYAGKYAEIAAQSPTLINQITAQRWDEAYKERALHLQEVTARQQHVMAIAEMKARGIDMKAQRSLEAGRLGVSQGNLKIAAARLGVSVSNYKLQANKAAKDWKKWNVEQANKQTKVNVSLSKAYGYPVNDQGVRIKGAPPIPKTATSSGGGGLSSSKRADLIDDANTIATKLYTTWSDESAAQGIKKVLRPEAYRRVRFYLKQHFKGMTAKKLNQLTEQALVIGGYPGAK